MTLVNDEFCSVICEFVVRCIEDKQYVASWWKELKCVGNSHIKRATLSLLSKVSLLVGHWEARAQNV